MITITVIVGMSTVTVALYLDYTQIARIAKTAAIAMTNIRKREKFITVECAKER